MFATGKHLEQSSLSQGWKTYKAWAASCGRAAGTFNAYREREDVQAAYGQVVNTEATSELEQLRARIAELEGKSTPPAAPNSMIGVKYHAKNGGRVHTIVRVKGEFAISDTGNEFRVNLLESYLRNSDARKAKGKAYATR